MLINTYPNIHSTSNSTRGRSFSHSNKFLLISYPLIFRQLPSRCKLNKCKGKLRRRLYPRLLFRMFRINWNHQYLHHNTTPKYKPCFSCRKSKYWFKGARKSQTCWLQKFSKIHLQQTLPKWCKSLCSNYNSPNHSRCRSKLRLAWIQVQPSSPHKVSRLFATFIQAKFYHFQLTNKPIQILRFRPRWHR
jgi:hypothetical protein